MTVRRWVIGAAVAVTLTACGADTAGNDDGDGGPSSPPPSSPTPTTAGPTGATQTNEVLHPTSVSVVRGGGIRPTRVSLQFAEDEPPPKGYTSADTAAVLAAADDSALRSATQPTIGSTCCDQYVYVVTVHWSDDVTTRFSAVQGAIQPPALARVITRAESPS